VGAAYNGLAQDLEGVNFSSLRMGAIQERDVWMALQEWLIDTLLRPLFEDWLLVSLELGVITTPSGRPLPPERFPLYRPARFVARRWPWVEPLKDMQTAREAYSLRVKSLSQIIREMGQEPEDVWREIAADPATMERLGVGPAEVLGAAQQMAQEDEDEDDQ